MINQVILDCTIKKDVQVFSDCVNFTISAPTGYSILSDNTKRNRYTYIKAIYIGKNGEILKDLSPDEPIRIHGELDSEQYENKNGKIVFNKVLIVKEIFKVGEDGVEERIL